MNGQSFRELLKHEITEETLIRAALADLPHDVEDRDAISAVFHAWVAVRDSYLEDLTLFILENQDNDRLARWARRILERATLRYEEPFCRWEGTYCDYDGNCGHELDCGGCTSDTGCNIRDDLACTAAGTIATVIFIWQENTGTLPFPEEPTPEAVLAYLKKNEKVRITALKNGTCVEAPMLL